MSDKSNLEKFLKNFVAGEKEAAASYFNAVVSAKTNRLVNEAVEEDEKKKEDKDMDKTKPKVEDEDMGDEKSTKMKKVDAKKAEGKLKSKKEE